MIKKDFIVRRTITEIEGKPHVETYSEEELVRCTDCEYYNVEAYHCKLHNMLESEDWYCADGRRKEETYEWSAGCEDGSGTYRGA